MVKFSLVLESQAVPSWQAHYMSYNRLKRKLDVCVHLRSELIKIQSNIHGPGARAAMMRSESLGEVRK